MLAQFFRNSAVYGIAGIFSRGISVILLPIYTRVLSPEEYGILDILIVCATLANYVVAMEISQGVARYYSETTDPKNKAEYASTALWFAGVAYILFVVIGLYFGECMSHLIMGSADFESIFQVALVAVAVNGMFYLLQDLLRWQFQALRYSMGSLIYTLASTLLAIYLVVNLQTGVLGIFYGQVAGAILGIVYTLLSRVKPYGWVFSWSKCRIMLTYSFPLVLTSIAYYCSLYVDRIAIKQLMTLGDVGIYGVGARIASVFALLMIGFQSALTPLIYHHHEKVSTPSDLARIFRYFLAIALPFLLCVSIFSKELVWVFTTPEYYDAWIVVPILSCSVLLASMYIFAPGLFLRKSTKIVALIHVAALGINIVLNVLLIPVFGIIGSAIATFLSTAITFLIYMNLSQKLYKVPHRWRTIVIALIMFIGAALTGFINETMIVKFDLKDLLINLVITITASLAMIYTLLGRRELVIISNKIKSKLPFHKDCNI